MPGGTTFKVSIFRNHNKLNFNKQILGLTPIVNNYMGYQQVFPCFWVNMLQCGLKLKKLAINQLFLII
jgi:hypothetical protein